MAYELLWQKKQFVTTSVPLKYQNSDNCGSPLANTLDIVLGVNLRSEII